MGFRTYQSLPCLKNSETFPAGGMDEVGREEKRTQPPPCSVLHLGGEERPKDNFFNQK